MVEWKSVLGGAYEVSSQGVVRRATPGRRTYVGRVLNPVRMSVGYLSVAPTVGGRNVSVYVHRLVAEAFLGPCPEGHEVNHIDGVKTNNDVANLEYVTHAGNMRHASRTGLSAVGERCRRSHLRDQDIRDMRAAWEAGESGLALSRRFGVAPVTVSLIVNRKTWRSVA